MASADVLNDRFEPRELEDEMKTAYLDYAMSVIVGRALPDVRDGLKPVHRRVLYGMSELGLGPTRGYAKCARIVGEVMGNYHPHGDSAIYDTLVRMAQDFSMRYPLVDGQGNFGSVDDDPAAAMRYTEARLTRLAMEMLRDLDMDTVDFAPNYDGRTQEPLVLPVALPEPARQRRVRHRRRAWRRTSRRTTCGEVIDATVAFIDDPQITIDGLMQHIKGPDFPTGGTILGRQGIRDAYETGRGRVRVRAQGPHRAADPGQGGDRRHRAALPGQEGRRRRADHEDRRPRPRQEDPGHHRPARRVRPQRHAPGDRAQARRDPEGRAEPALQAHEHAVDVRRQRRRARRRRAADAVAARDPRRLRRAPARGRRPPRQARARAQGGARTRPRGPADRARQPRRGHRADPRLQGPRERPRAADGAASASARSRRPRSSTCASRSSPPSSPARSSSEHADVTERIRELRELLGDEGRVLTVIKDELIELRERFADERRTEITASEDEIDIEDLIADQQMVITITHTGYIKSLAARHLPPAAARRPRRHRDGHEGRRLHRAPLRLLVARLPAVLLQPRQGLPLEGLRAARGVADRARAARSSTCCRCARASGSRPCSPTRDFTETKYLVFATAQRDGQEDRVPGLQHADQGRRHHRDQHPRRRRAARRCAPSTPRTRSSWSPAPA